MFDNRTKEIPCCSISGRPHTPRCWEARFVLARLLFQRQQQAEGRHKGQLQVPAGLQQRRGRVAVLPREAAAAGAPPAPAATAAAAPPAPEHAASREGGAVRQQQPRGLGGSSSSRRRGQGA